MKKNFSLSIIVPAYNEEKILANTLKKISKTIETITPVWEIVVVDDGSHDKTFEIAQSFSKKHVVAVKIEPNQGKGAALRHGMATASGDFIIFTDADLSVPLTFIEPILMELKRTPVSIGSRRTSGSTIEVHQPVLRETLGRIYTFITRVVTGVRLTDFTCGFKGFQKKAGKKIFAASKIDRWGYDAEILFLAHKYGFAISEVPVSWKNREDTRVRLGGAVITSFRDLLKIRLLDLMGVYA